MNNTILKFVARHLFVLLTLSLWQGLAQAEAVNIERLVDAVYLAEGGAKTHHPYGILTKYKHTTPRQACINSIRSAIKRAGTTEHTKVIPEMGRVYCPVGASNDPNGLNVNWVRNTMKIYERRIK